MLTTKKKSKTPGKRSTTTCQGGTWTQGKFDTFIRSLLRGGFRKYPPKYEVLKEAAVGKKINPASKRLAEHYRCATCKKDYPQKEVNVDHIQPVTDPVTGFQGWDVYVKRMFCSKSNLQVLCSDCHDIKTAEERELRK